MSASAPTPASAGGRHGLRAGLSDRQLAMIGLGGVIGAGLFVGSGKAVGSTGPGVVCIYLVGGALVMLVMRMLAELSVASPDTGAFSVYAGRELGRWAGLAIGWLYAYHWWVVIAFEAVAGAALVRQLVPWVPTWSAALVILALQAGANMLSVALFGHIEYWLALIKVTAIVVFIGIGILAMAGLLPHVTAPGLSNLTGHGGLFPHGAAPILPALLTVFFSYFGTESVSLAAGESHDPATALRRGMSSVAWRIIVFYVGSILVVVTLLPSGARAITVSPYTAVLSHLGIPAAATIMNIVVLVAVLSCLNSGLYASSRMVYSMAVRRDAPAVLSRVTTAGVPYCAVLLSTAAGFLAVIANYFLPVDVVFGFLLNSSGATAVVVYLCITATHLAERRRLGRLAATLPLRMWAYPYLSILVLAVLLGIVVGMVFTPGSREPLALTALTTAVAIAVGVLRQRRHTAVAVD